MKFYFVGRSDSVKEKTMGGHKYIEANLMFGDKYQPEVISMRLNHPVDSDVPVLWINTDGAKAPFRLVIDGKDFTG